MSTRDAGYWKSKTFGRRKEEVQSALTSEDMHRHLSSDVAVCGRLTRSMWGIP
jgi:hypothetical protein